MNFRSALEHSGIDATPAIGHQSRKVAHLLTARGLPYPFLEEPVYDGDELVAQTDLSFAVPLVGFIDGYGPHKSRQQMNRDRWQRQRLRNMGLTVFEFTADQTYKSPGYVANSTLAMYRDAERLMRVAPDRVRWWTDRPLPGNPDS